MTFLTNTSPEFRFAKQIGNQVEAIARRGGIHLFGSNPAFVEYVGEIAVIKGQPLTQVASGVSVVHRGVEFIVTAAHVLDDLKRPGGDIYVATGNNVHPFRLDPKSVSAVDQANDVAAIKLLPEQVERLAKMGARFLNADGILLEPDIAEWHCFAGGHMASSATYSTDSHALALKFFCYWTTLFTGALNTPSYDPARHLLLAYPQGASSFADGEPMPVPDNLRGLSGTSAWCVFLDEHMDGRWDINLQKSVGIQTHTYTKNPTDPLPTAIQCTKWKCVMPLLDHLL